MKFILIGGSGFVGQHLAAELAKRGQEAVICDIAEPATPEIGSFVRTDVTDWASVRALPLEEDDIVIHLAANQYHGRVPRRDRQAYFAHTNVCGTANILQVMEQRRAKRMIYFSTDMVYGRPSYLPIDTEHPKLPFGPYGESKRESELLCGRYRDKGARITVFRPRMIIGPGRLGVLKKLFRLIEAGLPVPLIGSGANHYQMIAVADCVQAVMRAIDLDCPNEAYNLGSKNPPTVRELLGSLITRVNSRSRLIPTPGSAVKAVLSGLSAAGVELLYKEQYMIADENYLVDISKTERELGWSPLYSDDDMLMASYSTYKLAAAR